MRSTEDCCEEVLIALRRITRAIDLQSRRLMQTADITGPQLLVLQALQRRGSMTIGQVASMVNLSQGTVTSILERLMKKALVEKVRGIEDKRKVYVNLTDPGREVLRRAPTPLQESFVKRFRELQDWEQNLVLSSLQRIAEMMNAQNFEVEPILDNHPLSGGNDMLSDK